MNPALFKNSNMFKKPRYDGIQKKGGVNPVVYLDYNATTPIYQEVISAMEPFYNQKYGNPSSIHQAGREAKKAIEHARDKVAGLLGTEPVDIIFTSGGTESNNLAIIGTALANKKSGNHIITSSIEHLSVLETCGYLQKNGFEVTYLPVDEYGIVNPADLKNAIKDNTTLVTIMHANNETGAIQPICELAGVVKQANKNSKNSQRVYFHTDSVQSFGKIAVDVEDLGADLLSLSAHKIYGPKGAGALYIRKGINIIPQHFGGHQERTLRAGTENVPAIAGFGKAAELARKNFHMNEKIKMLRDMLFDGLKDKIQDLYLNGHPQKNLPNTLNISFGNIEAETLLINFDIKGICASTGSACTSGSLEQSHVLKAMGQERARIKSSVRFSLGTLTTQQDIAYCIKEIPAIVRKLRKK